MKRNTLFGAISALIIVFMFSFLCTQYLIPIVELNRNEPVVYSQTYCITDQITNEMTVYDIAKKYRDSNAIVQIMGQYNSGTSRVSTLGSGVVVASTGYQTTTLDENITASMGAYIATNYHVVDFLFNSYNTSATLKVRAEDEVEHSCEVLWYNKNFDLAIIYADVSYNYIKMADRWVACEENTKLDYEPAFIIGSPLEKQNINRLTVGNIASNNEILMYTGETIYVNTREEPATYTIDRTSYSQTQMTVLDNIYEDVIDIAIGMSGGNSGGGVFDENGNLVGLATLGTSVSETQGNQINGAVAIYPVMKVLDKVIANKETSSNYKIYSLSNLGIDGIDSIEAYYAKAYSTTINGSTYYFINGKLYKNSNEFDFDDDGFKVLDYTDQNIITNYPISINYQYSVITKITTADNVEHDIKNRNDLLYVIVGLNEGDSIKITYNGNENVVVWTV